MKQSQSACHADVLLLSWSFSFLVGQDGVIYEGVGWNVQGSRAPGYNDIALGIAFMGTFLGKWMLWAMTMTFYGMVSERVCLMWTTTASNSGITESLHILD